MPASRFSPASLSDSASKQPLLSAETWAPQAYLVYRSLAKYKHIPAVDAARQGLAAQHLSLLLSVWRTHHHICENFASTWQGEGGDCTGNHMYSWGGLGTLMALEEAGLYQ